MYVVSDRKGNTQKEASLLDSLLTVLCRHMLGRMAVRPFVSPAVSKLGGMLLDTRLSAILIRPFIRLHAIDMADFEQKKYVSYNDFFKRAIKPGRRTVGQGEAFISPCDSKLQVFKVDSQSCFYIKQTPYTLESLLHSKKLAKRYAGGYAWIFRLGVEDYHRYIYIDGGQVSKSVKVRGVFHTVKPAAVAHIPVYKENTREYCLLKTQKFGNVLTMEVGALMVVKIENRPQCKTVCRGEEKGNFAFGGSTIILLTQKHKVWPAGDILRNSSKGIETRVQLGERVGVKGRIG